MELHREQALIQAAQQGDEQAFGAIYDACVDPIYRYIAHRVNSIEVAQDLTADVFLRVVEGLPSYEYRGVPFTAWVYRIAQARIIDFFRQARHTVEQPVFDDLNLSTDDDSDGALEADDQHVRLKTAIRDLTPEQQHVIFLRFTEGYDLQTTAKLLGKTTGAVKLMQHRALRALNKALKEPDAGDAQRSRREEAYSRIIFHRYTYARGSTHGTPTHSHQAPCFGRHASHP